MTPEMVETFRYLRDYGKPISQQDAADYAKLRAPQPPSKAHLKTIKRHQQGREIHAPIREYSQPSPETLAMRRQNEFHKKIIGQLGGSLTVAPSAPRDRPFVDYVPNKRDTPATCEVQTWYEKAAKEEKRLGRITELAKSRMLYQEYEPDMFEILDKFGSFERFGKEVA